MSQNALTSITESIDALIENKEAIVYAFAQTGLDETGLIATRDGYLRSAKELLEFVIAAEQGKASPITYGEVEGFGDSSIGGLSDFVSEIQIDSTFLAATEADAEKAGRYMNELL